MKPDQEKKNVRPYLFSGLRIGIERAFLLIRFTSGAVHRWETLKGIFVDVLELEVRVDVEEMSFENLEIWRGDVGEKGTKDHEDKNRAEQGRN